jgi:hypothetical protein
LSDSPLIFLSFQARIGSRRSETATMVVERLVVAPAPSTSAVVSVVALDPLTDDDDVETIVETIADELPIAVESGASVVVGATGTVVVVVVVVPVLGCVVAATGVGIGVGIGEGLGVGLIGFGVGFGVGMKPGGFVATACGVTIGPFGPLLVQLVSLVHTHCDTPNDWNARSKEISLRVTVQFAPSPIAHRFGSELAVVGKVLPVPLMRMFAHEW